MTEPLPGNKRTTQVLVAGAAAVGTYYVARRYLFTPRPVEYAVEPGSEQAPESPPLPSPSGVVPNYQYPTTSPWFSNAITVPVNPEQPNTGGGGGGGGGNNNGGSGATGDAAEQNNWGPAVKGDEFGYTGAPNPGLWSVYQGEGHNRHGRRVASAWEVKDGKCICTGNTVGDTGGMAFRQSVGTRYRIQTRARVYKTGRGSGDRYHVALGTWPDAENWPFGGEDDYCEIDVPESTVHTFIHHSRASEGNQQSHATTSVDTAQFHNYAIERSSTRVKTWVDGILVANFSMEELGGQLPGGMHPFLQLDWVDKNGTTLEEAKLEFEWFRIYAAP